MISDWVWDWIQVETPDDIDDRSRDRRGGLSSDQSEINLKSEVVNLKSQRGSSSFHDECSRENGDRGNATARIERLSQHERPKHDSDERVYVRVK